MTQKRLRYSVPSQPQVFNDKICPYVCYVAQPTSTVCQGKALPNVEEDESQGVHKLTEYIQVHGTRSEAPNNDDGAAVVIARPFSITFARSWQSEKVPDDWKNAVCLTNLQEV